MYGSTSNVVVKGLFEKYPTVEALAAADVADIEESYDPVVLERARQEISANV